MQQSHPFTELPLETCFRCDRSILHVSEFVANLDPQRLHKNTIPCADADIGEVHLMQFENQFEEAEGIAMMCQFLTKKQNIDPSTILILLRSDHNNALSKILRNSFKRYQVPIAENIEENPLDKDEGRLVISILSLLVDREDSLSWRTALMLKKGIGPKSIRAVEELARKNNTRFSNALQMIKENPDRVPQFGNKLMETVVEYEDLLETLSREETLLVNIIQRVTQFVSQNPETNSIIVTYLQGIAEETGSEILNDLINAISASMGASEQELIAGAVNILTMHKAKGLDADIVFIAGAEDEFIPGRNEGEREGDERRLLFVSMTRAKHRLYISYCNQRVGHQSHLGRNSGNPLRNLTRFLQDAPIRVEKGKEFVVNTTV